VLCQLSYTGGPATRLELATTRLQGEVTRLYHYGEWKPFELSEKQSDVQV
jgi:hypothetical protein